MARVVPVLTAAAVLGLGWLTISAGATASWAQTVPAAASKADAGSSGASKRRDPAEFEKALATAQKSLTSGKADVAVKQIDTLVNAGGLEPRNVARALAVRGHAHRKLGKPVQAIADFQSALFVKNGLSETERAGAMEARAQAQREAGLADSAPAAGGGSAKYNVRTADARPSDARPSDARSSAPVTTATVPEKPVQTASSGGISGFFSNLFGGSNTPEPPSKSGSPDVTAAPAPAPQSPALSSWSDPTKSKAQPKTAVATNVPKVTPQPRPVRTPEAAKAEPAKASPGPAAGAIMSEPAPTQFVLRLAAKRTSADAKSLAERVKSEHAADLGNRGYTIDETVFGNMGKFYRANVGPIADLQGAKTLCSAIRARGTDCEVISR